MCAERINQAFWYVLAPPVYGTRVVSWVGNQQASIEIHFLVAVYSVWAYIINMRIASNNFPYTVLFWIFELFKKLTYWPIFVLQLSKSLFGFCWCHYCLFFHFWKMKKHLCSFLLSCFPSCLMLCNHHQRS